MSQYPSVLPVYRRADVIMQRGEGVYLHDNAKNKYLDFASGIAVNALGHSHPKILKALQSQAKELWHCSNQFYTQPLIDFSERLVHASFAHSVFCCSSGTEAVEAAIKFIRRYHYKTGSGRYRIIVAEGGFHGRTLGALSACGHPSAIAGYAPLLEGFDRVPFNDIAALQQTITKETAAVMLEPIQGEGGVRPHSPDYLQAVRELCNEHGLLLFLDEVQCGMARPGRLFAYEHYAVTPDIVTIGKAIGNGYPLAACLVNEKVAETMEPGCHGSTYGSNPLAMMVGLAVLDVLMDEAMLLHVRQQGEAMQKKLSDLVMQYPRHLAEVRGIGLMLGIQTHISAYELTARLRQAGLIVAAAGDRVLRILPPLIIEDKHADEALAKLNEVLTSW